MTRVLEVYRSTEHAAKEDLRTMPTWLRNAVLERDQYQCQVCGTGGENRLQLHHLEYRSQGGKHVQDNLVTLCFRCHQDLHDGKLDVQLLEVAPGVMSAFVNIEYYHPKQRSE